MLEEDFDSGEVFAFLECFEVHDFLSLFELLRCFAVERPKHGVEQGRLTDTVLRVEEGDVALGARCEFEFVFPVELSEVLEANL